MLYFQADEVLVNEKKRFCRLCLDRKASWRAKLKNGHDQDHAEDCEVGSVCAWCLLYSGKTVWGHDNRKELQEVGRAAAEQAARYQKSVPELDERGRLDPVSAERFVRGVLFTSRVLVGRLVTRAANWTSESNTSDHKLVK